MKTETLVTIPNYTHEPTSDPNIFRFVDRAGDWTHYWIKDQRMFVPAVNHVIRVGFPKGERFYDYLLNAHPDEARRRLATAGEEGARSHEAIRDLIRGDRINLDTRYFNELTDRYEPLSRDEWSNIEAFYEWCMKYDPHVAFYETAVWSKTHRFAGTIDFIGTISVSEGDKLFPKESWGTRILILIDWKTSSGIWDEYELQVASYRKAALEYIPDKLPRELRGNVWTGIVRLGTNHKLGFEMKVWDPETSEKNFDIFCAAEQIYRRKEGEDFEPDIEHSPREFAIQIPLVAAEPEVQVTENTTGNKIQDKTNKTEDKDKEDKPERKPKNKQNNQKSEKKNEKIKKSKFMKNKQQKIKQNK